MFKKLQTIILSVLTVSVPAIAADISGISKTSLLNSAKTEFVQQRSVDSEQVTAQSAQQDESATSEIAQTLLSRYAAVSSPLNLTIDNNGRVESPLATMPTFSATFSSSAISRQRMSAPRTGTSKTAQVHAGCIIAKDTNIKGQLYTASMTLEKQAEDNQYKLSNLYCLGDTTVISLTIDQATGKVTIPSQVIMNHNVYGDVSICPITIGNTSVSYTFNDIEGTIDENGVITLDSWGIIITGDTNYHNQAFNFFESSTWAPANATVKCTNITQDGSAPAEYGILIEQTGENSANIYCLAGIPSLGDVLGARLTASKTMLISPQLIYNNLFYGPFFMYGTSWTADGKASINATDPMVYTFATDGSLTTPGYVIAARQLPSQYVGYARKDITISGDFQIKWPEQLATNFDGDGTAQSPYLIKSINDFKALSQAVESGNTYAGTHFRLANDINMSSMSPAEYVPIGTGNSQFCGTFNGDGKTISGLRINGYGNTYTGLFGVIGRSGVISNLNIDQMVISSVGNNIGAIAAFNYGTIKNCNVTKTSLHSDGELIAGIAGGMIQGTISDCSFYGSITGIGSAAGIVGQGSGTIERCNARANITIDGYISSTCRDAAGIAGVLQSGVMTDCWASGAIIDSYGYAAMGGLVGRNIDGTIANSFSAAVLQAKTASTSTNTYTGGIAGYTMGGSISDSYNAGTIIQSSSAQTTSTEAIGGIVGYLAVGYSSTSGQPTVMINQTYVTNCYNSGQIITPSKNGKKGIYGRTFLYDAYTGPSPEDQCFKNCFFDQQISIVKDSKYGKNTAEIIGSIPAGFDATVWQAEAGKYPVIKTSAASQAAALSSSPVVLRANDHATKVKVSFAVNPTQNVAWGISSDNSIVTETDALKMEGSTFTVKDQYANSVIEASSADGWALKLYRLAIVPKVFDGEGTAEDPYQIKDIVDFAKLDNAVSNYGQAHVDDYFAMTADIDFKYSDQFQGVGYGKGASVSFGGHFDGRGHTLHNLKIDAVKYDTDGKAINSTMPDGSYSYCGLFNILGETGSIKNITIAEDCDFSFFSYSGPVTGWNLGTIENCRNYANVKSANAYLGGIAGINAGGGTLKGCYNAGEVRTGHSNAGGIAGYNIATASITGCQNDGDVMGATVNIATQNVKYNTIGGISGSNYGSITSCVNNGTITGYNTVGGITGSISSYNNEGIVTGCVNNGFVNVHETTTARGGIIGNLASYTTIASNFFDCAININGGAGNNAFEGTTGLATSEMVSGSALEGLDSELYDFTAGSYPVLKAFAQEPATKALRNMYVKFAKGQVRNNILSDTELASAQGTTYTLKVNNNFKINGSTLTVSVPTDNTVALDTITATNGNYTKTLALGSVPTIFKGEGTAQSPYLIETPADWNKLADFMMESKWEYANSHFRVENDIDFAGDSIHVIGVDGTNFQGTFNGNGKTIKNYVYSNPNSIKTRLTGPNLYVGKNIGIFGTLGSEGTIKDLTINGDYSAYQALGALVGEVYGTVENCVHKGSISNTSGNACAGIAYRVNGGGVLRNCVNEGTVTTKATSACGIAYQISADAIAENCVNKGTITSGTSGAVGIAYQNNGILRNCVNEGKLKSASATGGTACGICNTVGATGIIESCRNLVDINYSGKGNNIAGVFYNSTKGATGYCRDSYNTGNITGKGSVSGFCNNIKEGFDVTNCYNTGNVKAESATHATGFAQTIKGAAIDDLTVIENCYNTGNVTCLKGPAAGFAEEASYYTVIRDCYNMGNVYSINHTTLCSAGIANKGNGLIERCFNTGDIKSSGYAVGGIAGYISGTQADYPGTIVNSFNLGNVTSTYTGTSTNGNAGGLVGYFATNSPVLRNSYNAGNVHGIRRVAGLVAGMFNPSGVIENCYNSGKVTCENTDQSSTGKDWKFWSGTVFTNNPTSADGTSYFANSKNVYYDKTVNPDAEWPQFRNFPNSGKTTTEMAELIISDEFAESAIGGYPVLKAFADKACSDISSAMILITGDNHDKVTGNITLIGPADATWTVADAESNAPSTALIIDGTTATPKAEASVKLTVTDKTGSAKKDFLLTLAPLQTSVDDLFAGKQIDTVTYIDIQGRQVTHPVAGNVYVVKTVYTDGTMKVEKVLAKD